MTGLVQNEKQVWEDFDIPFDFTNRGIASGVSIASITEIVQDVPTGSTTPLTISGTTYSGLAAKARFGAGTIGCNYKLTCRAVMTDGQKYECDGKLKVKEK